MPKKRKSDFRRGFEKLKDVIQKKFILYKWKKKRQKEDEELFMNDPVEKKKPESTLEFASNLIKHMSKTEYIEKESQS